MWDTTPNSFSLRVTPVCRIESSLFDRKTVNNVACFLGAIQAAAAKQGKKKAVSQAVVHADVALGLPTDRAGYGLKVALRVEGVEDQAVIDAAHEVGRQIIKLSKED
jgi:hypothetical protein